MHKCIGASHLTPFMKIRSDTSRKLRGAIVFFPLQGCCTATVDTFEYRRHDTALNVLGSLDIDSGNPE